MHLSADGVVVVHHDATLDRTTNAVGPDRGAHRGRAGARGRRGTVSSAAGAFPFRGQGIGVPTLRDVLRRYRGMPIIIEMKVDTAEMGRARRGGGSTRRRRAIASARPVSVRRSARAARAALPEVATSACSAEVRLALYRSWAALAGAPARPTAAIRCRSVVEMGRGSCRRASFVHAHAARPQGAGLDRGRAGRHGAAAGLGRRRPDQ